ncbi:MAG: T9SS type A sorting domain-containing protein [Ignavibacteriaceae bacterium]|nr:T9SS type A sorting domain-containing protein [Ignavibacteriaceae bacterium]
MKSHSYLFTFILFVCLASNILSQYQNIRVDGPLSNSPEEVTIAINPVNPNVLAAGANIDHFYVSTDAGNTWIESRLVSNLLGVWGDPVVLFDSLGNLYYSHLSNPVSGWWIDRIVVQKSTNNGVSWNDGVGVGLNNYPKQQDKEWLAVDLTQSPYRGNVYMTWTEFDDYGSSNPNDSSRIRFSKSTNEGETWSDAITISDISGNCIDDDLTTEGAVPCIGPNGEIYVSWAGPAGIVFDKSTDGGATWGADVFVNSMPGGWAFDVSGISRCNGMPITMCDLSGSPYNGHIFIVWSDQRNGATNTDIFMSKSTDAGETWSPQLKINDDNTARHQFFVWSDIDQSTGHIWCAFYDRRNTTGIDTDVFVAKSTDGGATFENFKVSESSFTPTSSIFFGDYTNIAAWNGKIYPIWMRLHNSQLSVWVAPLTDSTTITHSEIDKNIPSYYVLFQNYPNPFNPSTTISYQLPEAAFVTLSVFDVLGNEIQTLTNNFMQAGVHEIIFDASDFSSGMYFYRIIANEFEQMNKMILIK